MSTAVVEHAANTGKGPALRLPPLILHPFSAPEDASALVESSRANLKAQSLAGNEQPIPADIGSVLLRGRYAEIKMLYYIGKDVSRWMSQCAESVQNRKEFSSLRMRPETFGLFLVQHVPLHVRTKLENWGVLDYIALFRRSIALHSVFAKLPEVSDLNEDFLRWYHRHLDQWFEFAVRNSSCYRAQPADFTFELFASGEYAHMLERSWTEAQ